jgi:phosphohistidine swiveling domain-containing protein
MAAIDSVVGIENLKSHYFQFADDLLLSLKNLDKNLGPKNLDNFIKNYTRFCAGLFLTSTIGRAGMSELSRLLGNKGIPEEDIPETIGIITYPDDHTPLFKSQLDLLVIAKKVQLEKIPEKEKNDLLVDWLNRHGFIPVSFCEDPWTIDDAKNQLSGLLLKDCSEELEKFTKNHDVKILEKQKRLNKLGDEKINILSKALAEGTYLNEFRKNIFSQVSLGYRNIFAQIARLGGSDNWRDCFYLTPDEMRSLLEGANFKISEIIPERLAVGFYTDTNGISHMLGENDLKKFVEFINVTYGNSATINPEDIKKEVKGFSASKGKVIGTVKVVLSTKDFCKVNPGDILVTTMTSVDFVPVMERAAAFVTNEGGITSHAAIVAREMNKPCIIGTKIATQVLKDGDVVEVNADKGTVKIIKHAGEQ